MFQERFHRLLPLSGVGRGKHHVHDRCKQPKFAEEYRPDGRRPRDRKTQERPERGIRFHSQASKVGTDPSAGRHFTDQRTQATYDVVTGGDVTVDTQTTPATITLVTDTDGTKAEGIVLPCTDTVGMLLEFRLQSGATYTWAVKEAPLSQQFEAGSKYKYAITISNTGLEVTSTVTDWTPGNGSGESGSAQ